MNARWHPPLVAGARVQASVDAGAVAHNLAVIRARADAAMPAPRIWATAKADAYGHGLARVMPGLKDADGIAVQQLPEAHACRAAGWQGPILVYGGLLSEDDLALLDLPGLHLVISHEAQLDWLSATPPRPDAPAIWLRYDGDIRLAGFGREAYLRAYERCAALAAQHRVGALGHLSHYARAEDEDGVADADASFRQAIAGLPGPVSTCNSAALLRHPAHVAATDWIRPGIALYGVSPLAGVDGAALGLRPAMSLTARLFAVQTLQAGASIGYRSAFVAAHDMRVGLVSCGYSDGYPRHAGTGTPVLADGVMTRVLGRVTMDVMMIDLDGVDHAAPGMPVTLWGTPELPVETVAASAGTIAAELLTGLTARVPITARP